MLSMHVHVGSVLGFGIVIKRSRLQLQAGEHATILWPLYMLRNGSGQYSGRKLFASGKVTVGLALDWPCLAVRLPSDF